MPDVAAALAAIGTFLLLGLAADALGRRTFLPRVTLLLGIGIAIGGEGLDLIPATISERFELITSIALMVIGFLLGGKLTLANLRTDSGPLVVISLAAALVTTILVSWVLILAGLTPGAAILLGCIAAATAPAATVDTALEYGGDTRFRRLLIGIVAVDDVWALLLFSVGLAIATVLESVDGTATGPLLQAGSEVGGAFLLGGVLGAPAAYLTGRIRAGQPMLTEALGLVMICGGVALWFDVSYLIATMTMGAVITNLARHHDYPFHEIENVEWPFLVVFFILAGASLEFEPLRALGLLGVLYLVARTAGKQLGSWLGAVASHADSAVRRFMGMALLPQAGVSIGMALLASHRFPDYGPIILPAVIGSTVVFEVVGPVCTREALRRSQL